MRICLKFQKDVCLAAKLLPTRFYSASALPLEIEGLGDEPSVVTVSLTNADGQMVTGTCTQLGRVWATVFAAENFDHYGTVTNGLRISATYGTGATSYSVIVAIGDVVIAASSANAQPGQSGNYVVKGSDQYFKTYVLSGVQHYTKQGMVYDPEIGWGAEWVGDYVINAAGDFEPWSAGE